MIAAINSLVSRSRKSYYLYGFVQSINAGRKDYFSKDWENKQHDAPHATTVHYYRYSYEANLLMFEFLNFAWLLLNTIYYGFPANFTLMSNSTVVANCK